MDAERDTRDRIVDAAMDLFVYQGYAQTGLAQIAKAAGARPGSLYYFFPSKEDLLRAVLERRKQQLWPEVLDPVWKRIDDPIERVFSLLANYRAMLVQTDYLHGCPIGNLAIELTNSHPNARRLIAENFDQWKDAVRECFAAAADRLPPECDHAALATFVLVTMEGAVMLARTHRNPEAYDAAVICLRDYVERLTAAATHWSRPADSAAGPEVHR